MLPAMSDDVNVNDDQGMAAINAAFHRADAEAGRTQPRTLEQPPTPPPEPLPTTTGACAPEGKKSTRTSTRKSGQKPPARELPAHIGGGGYTRVSNEVIEYLMRVMPDSAFKAYAYCCKLAAPDGTFYVGHAALAEKIGRRSHTSGQRAMVLLRRAGLVRTLPGGGHGGLANNYQLTSIKDLDQAKAVLAGGLPWAPGTATATMSAAVSAAASAASLPMSTAVTA